MSVKREAKAKADRPFQETADTATLKELTDIIESYGLTLDDIVNESWARTVFDVLQLQQYMRENPYKPVNLTRQKRLFDI